MQGNFFPVHWTIEHSGWAATGQKSVHKHNNVVGQELWWLKSTPTPLLPLLKTMGICPLEHLRAFWICQKCQWTKYWHRNSKWNVCAFHVISSLDHMRTNGASSPVGRGKTEETSRPRLQVLWESDHYRRITDLLLRSQIQMGKWGVAAKRGTKTSESSAVEISWKGLIGGIFWLFGDDLSKYLSYRGKN